MKNFFLRFLFLFSVSVFLYTSTGFWSSISRFADNVISFVAYPFLKLNQKILFSKNGGKNLEKNNYEDLLAENIKLKNLESKYQDIKELVKFKNRYISEKNPPGIVTQILSKHFLPNQHYFLVEGGSNLKIKVDMIAVYKNCLIGKVIQVYPYYSKVQLITDKNCKVTVFCQNEKIRGIHEGLFKLNETKLTFAYNSKVNLRKALPEESLISSSGEGLIFPRGFGIAKILRFEDKDLEIDIFLTPLINLEEIDHCCLIDRNTEYQ